MSSFDGGSPQSWGTEHPLPLHDQRSLLVAGHALCISVQVGLNGVPHLLLWIEQSVWFTYKYHHSTNSLSKKKNPEINPTSMAVIDKLKQFISYDSLQFSTTTGIKLVQDALQERGIRHVPVIQHYSLHACT